MTAAYMRAGYLGGAYLSFRVARNDPWHRVAAGFPAIAAFTWAILLVTLLHWLPSPMVTWPSSCGSSCMP
jgi:hypothetical protein